MASVCNLLCIFQCLRCIWEKCCHLFFGLHVVLSAFIAHPILVCELFPCLKAKQDIMWLFIFCVSIMHVICRHKVDSNLLRQTHQLLVNGALFRDPMILQFQEKVAFPKNLFIMKRSFFSFFIHPSRQVSLYLSGKTCTEGNNSFVIGLQKLIIYSWLIIVTFRKCT